MAAMEKIGCFQFHGFGCWKHMQCGQSIEVQTFTSLDLGPKISFGIMPVSRVLTHEINKTVFKCFSPDSMSDDGEEEDEARWEETGAFPRMMPSRSDSNNHIFTDEPFENDFSTLEVVPEGSKDSTVDTSHDEDFTAFSTTSSDTPAVDNRVEAAIRKALANQQKQTPSPAQLSQGGSSGSSNKAIYPFNIYSSLSRLEEHKKNKKRDQDMASPSSSQPTEKAANTSFASGSSTSRSSHNKKVDIDEMPSPITPMSVGEESSSVMSETHSQVMETTSHHVVTAPHSVVSGRSRRQTRRYMVQHTLSTSQQVNANPATMLKNLFIGIEQERHMHKLAGQNLHAIHNWFLFLPCIFLTLLSGIVVLVFLADLNAIEEVQVYSSIFVGVTALISVFLQAVSKMLDMGTRGTLHDVTAIVLKRLSEDIVLTLSSTETIPAEYVALVSDKLGQALDACPSPLPYKVEVAFSSVSDRMVLMLKPPTGQPARKHVNKLDLMRLYSTMYDELSSEIIHSWAWPFLFPRPRSASEAALRNFKAIITEGREAVQRKQGCVRICCPCTAEDIVERSLFDVVPAASVGEVSSNTVQSNNQYQSRNGTMGHEV